MVFHKRIVSALRALPCDVHSAVHAVTVGSHTVRAHAGFSPEAISATIWLACLCSNTWSSKQHLLYEIVGCMGPRSNAGGSFAHADV